MATQFDQRLRQPSAVAAHAESLLNRYPNLSETELAELINLMPRLPVLDYGLMTADPQMSQRLDAFQRDHGDKIRPSTASIAALLMIPLIIGAALLFWWLTA